MSGELVLNFESLVEAETFYHDLTAIEEALATARHAGVERVVIRVDGQDAFPPLQPKADLPSQFLHLPQRVFDLPSISFDFETMDELHAFYMQRREGVLGTLVQSGLRVRLCFKGKVMREMFEPPAAETP